MYCDEHSKEHSSPQDSPDIADASLSDADLPLDPLLYGQDDVDLFTAPPEPPFPAGILQCSDFQCVLHVSLDSYTASTNKQLKNKSSAGYCGEKSLGLQLLKTVRSDSSWLLQDDWHCDDTCAAFTADHMAPTKVCGIWCSLIVAFVYLFC